MIEIKGKSVYHAIAVGRLYFYERDQAKIKRYHIDNTEEETKRFQTAKQTAYTELGELYEKALKEVGEANAMIFQIHQMMLEDLDYCESVENIIATQKVNAEYAVGTTADNFSQMFSQMNDEYMRERAADVKDVSERVLKILNGASSGGIRSDEPVIIVADDLAPSETVQLDKSKILGFVTCRGSSNSHTAILARTMNIPAIIGTGEISDEWNGHEAIIDGFTGTIYIDPDDAVRCAMCRRKKEEEEKIHLLQELKGKPNITLDGKTIKIYANIGGLSDIGSILQNDAGGIGLFRSEFLYLENDDYPTEEQQFAAYREVAQKMGGKKVIIRTLDIGADKKVDYFHLPEEENPALGYRAIRICLTRTDIFKTQLRALYRASAYGRISIMFPMIISVEEVRQIKEIAETVKNELRADGIPFDEHAELGIMIETPAAAVMSDVLAKEVDFFSIGTNDLTQYTLALDRQNQNLEPFYNPHHEAVLRLIKTVVDNGHEAGIWVGICGELGADTELTETFLKMGVDELSVSPSFVLRVRDKVRKTRVEE